MYPPNSAPEPIWPLSTYFSVGHAVRHNRFNQWCIYRSTSLPPLFDKFVSGPVNPAGAEFVFGLLPPPEAETDWCYAVTPGAGKRSVVEGSSLYQAAFSVEIRNKMRRLCQGYRQCIPYFLLHRCSACQPTRVILPHNSTRLTDIVRLGARRCITTASTAVTGDHDRRLGHDCFQDRNFRNSVAGY